MNRDICKRMQNPKVSRI